MALAATTTLATPIAGVSSNTMVTNDYQNGLTCGRKSPYINMLISAFCSRPNLSTTSPIASGGLLHDDYKISVNGPSCPSNSQWIPETYCLAQFHHICAVQSGPDGVGHMAFGANGCQEWVIEMV